jgi:hypothetical protein
METIPTEGKLRHVYKLKVKTGDVCYFLNVSPTGECAFIKIRAKVLDKTIHFAPVDTKINLKEIIGTGHTVLDYPWYLFGLDELSWFKKFALKHGTEFDVLIKSPKTDGDFIVAVAFLGLAQHESKISPTGKPPFYADLFLKAVKDFSA